MYRYQNTTLIIAIITLSGCHLLAVGISGMPGWSCIQAKEPISLFRSLDIASEVPQVSNASGMLNTGENARVLDRLKDPSGRTTHFLVRTQNKVKGWFVWKDNEFTGWSGSSCW